MSSTRRAKPGSEPRQERFCSSPEFERGLMANLVAKRCSLLEDPTEIEIVYFLQWLSHDDGGLQRVAQNLTRLYPQEIRTEKMNRIGVDLNRDYTPIEAEQIRTEIIDPISRYSYYRDEALPVEKALNICQSAASRSLAQFLSDLCLDPGREVSKGPWYFPNLFQCLTDYRARWISEHSAGCVVTEIGNKVQETLEYSLQEKCLTLVYGLHRIGKSKAAQHWCNLNPGIARFVEVPPGTDDISFFKAIAKALGISVSTGVKAVQLRERIEAVLETRHIMLALDEGHRLWPERNYRDAVPFRVSWVMAMVNAGVPVCIITTKQFFDAQKMIEKRSGWNSGQFLGRIAHCEVLPDALSNSDLQLIAKAFLPDADEKTVELLVTYAEASTKYIKGIEDSTRRARFLARKDGRETVTFSDVASAIKSGVMPSENALTEALQVRPQVGNRRTVDVSTSQVSAPGASPAQRLTRASSRNGSKNDAEVLFPQKVLERSGSAEVLKGEIAGE